MEAFDAFVASLLTVERWPFWAIAVIFAIIGEFTSKSVFTRPRAYAKGRYQSFWWWGRESLPLHPVLTGAALGFFVWVDPEGAGWSRVASGAYFAFAGAISLVLWVIIKGIAKQRGVDLELPGQTPIPPKE
jgi:hypothetical protein